MVFINFNSKSNVGLVLDQLVDELLHLLLVGYAFCDRVRGGRVDLLRQVHQEVEVPVLQVTVLDVFISLHVLSEIFLGGLLPDYRRELRLLDDCEFVSF